MKKTTIFALAFVAMVFGTIMLAEPTSASPGRRRGQSDVCISACQGDEFQRCCNDPVCQNQHRACGRRFCVTPFLCCRYC